MTAATASGDNATAAAPGRSCPLRYRYGPQALADAPQTETHTLYVIGGLYGNLQALDAVQSLAQAEPRPARLCFNGDFNWFDVHDRQFEALNRRVLDHDATLGNVEAEFDAPDDSAGCGCAYPESVDAATVAWSNQIHQRLKSTASRHDALRRRIAALPMVARYRVADCRVGVVHGDAESLSGWRFAVSALADPGQVAWRRQAFALAEVDLFASSHTCLPALHRMALTDGRSGVVANNGAAGMPNFGAGTGVGLGGRWDGCGLVTRIATTPSPHPVLHALRLSGAHVALLPLHFDRDRWLADFMDQWPEGSAARLSYLDRIRFGPDHSPAQSLAGL